MMTLVIATRNGHKVEEIRAILGAQFNYLTLNDFPGAPEIIEDADSFAGNAAKKAEGLAQWVASLAGQSRLGEPGLSWWVLADDSGLEVDVLNGAPGVHSARFAALDSGQIGNSATAENNAKLLRLMQTVPLAQRSARFRCMLALTPVLRPANGDEELTRKLELFEGICEGRIEFAAAGQGGFGYDPLFTPVGYQKTFAELGEAVKNGLSHRAKALSKLRAWFERR